MASQSGFIAQALASYLRNWKSPIDGKAPVSTWPSGWPKNAKCFHCKQLGHDPADGEQHSYTSIPQWGWNDLPKLVTDAN